MKPEELGCFEQVKAVLGEQGAIEELQKVIDCDGVNWQDKNNNDLIQVFEWATSPQDFEFWVGVHEGSVPQGYTPPSETKETKQVYVCSLNDDILVGTREQLLDLMIEQGVDSVRLRKHDHV